jgi:5-oxopent-3-ene-1,2,5-tricarboxylate decarboxylase / 2-hydroxyhepta-2,4-diene-1,7-dioate isomerase
MTEWRRVRVEGVVRDVVVEGGKFAWIDGRTLDAEEAEHLPPVTPRQIVCVHLNYRSRLDELNRKPPPAPTYFWKSVACLNAHGGKVVRPANCRFLNYEGEIALVVGRTTRNIHPAEAADYVLGYTIANDYGLHDFRDTDENSMVRVKGSDTLGPIGPGLVTGWDFRGKRIRTVIDGKVVQDGSTDEFLWDPLYLLADLTRTITFERGDMIFTGTPANSRPVSPGAKVAVEVEGLGRLENEIVSAPIGIPDGFGAQPSASDGVPSIALGSDFRKRD